MTLEDDVVQRPVRRVRRVRRPVSDEVMVDDSLGETSVVRAPWSPAQIVALAIGAT